MMTRQQVRLAAILVLGLCWGVPAQARLGETLEQLTERFGAPTLDYPPETLRPPITRQCEFRKDAIRIRACFRGEVCEKITYSSSGKAFTDKEAEGFLKANGATWIEEKNPTWAIVKGRKAQRMWRRNDSQAWAEQTGGSLAIMTFDWLRAEKDVAEGKTGGDAAGGKRTGF